MAWYWKVLCGLLVVCAVLVLLASMSTMIASEVFLWRQMMH